MKKHGKAVQQYADVQKEQFDELEKTKSTKVYNKIESEHIAETQEHIEATKEFLEHSKAKKNQVLEND